MASLSNINGIFDVHSTGAILFSTSHGTSGQILKSNGNAAPTWVAASTVIGGPYLPLTGGTLSGATATANGISFTVGGTLTGTSATFSGLVSGITPTAAANFATKAYVDGVTPGAGPFLKLDGTTTMTGSILQVTSESVIGSFKGTTPSGYAEFHIRNDVDHSLIMGSIGSTYTDADWAGSTYIYNGGSKKMYIKSQDELRLLTGGTSLSSNTALTIDTSQNATFTGLVSGITPTAAANFTTKAYVDSLSPPGGPYVTISTAQTITANKTFSTLTSFTASESIHFKGARGQFTNEFMHLYNKVGIGNPAGWGQGETSTPNQGLSVYGGSNFAYGTSATSTFYGPITATGKILLNANNINFESSYSGNGLVLSHHGVGPSNAIVSGDSVYPDNLYINNGGAANDWSNVIITGNVGIGIDTPQAPLSFDNIVGDKIDFYHNVTGSDRYGVEVQSSELRIFSGAQGASTGGITFGKKTTSTFTEAMRIRNDGNVGIGTTSPSNKLEVFAPGNGDGILIQSDSVGVNRAPALHLNPIAASANERNWAIAPFRDVPQSLSFSSSNAKGGNAYAVATTRMIIDGISGNVGIGVTSPGHKLEVNGGMRAGIAGGSSGNIPGLKVYAASASTDTTAAIAIQQGTSEGDTIIFADYEPHVEWGISAQNSTDQIHFTAGSSTNNLGSKTFYNNAGAARTAYIKFNHDLTDGTTLIGGQIGMGRDYNGGIYAINTSSTPGIDSNWGLEVQRTANVDDYNTRLKYYPVSGQSRKAGIFDSRNNRFSLYSDTNNNPDILIPHAFLGIGNTSPTYRLQLGTNGDLASSIRLGTYSVAKNTRQYIGYTRADSGLFEESGNGDTPSTVLAGVVGIRIVNTTGTLSSGAADNSVQLLTHIYNGGSRVALHASYNGNVGINNTSPDAYLRVDGTTSVTAARFYGTGGTRPPLELRQNNTAGWFAKFYSDNFGTYIGGISFYGSSTTFNTSSDYRLKENIIPISDSITRLKQLKPSRFNFKQYPEITIDGFLAHEVQEIVPEAVTGDKDELDSDGKPVYQAIDHSRLIPLLVAAIQELEARVKELENK